MVTPGYVGISLTMKIKPLNRYLNSENQIRSKIYETLDHTFRPLQHIFKNKEYKGWDFGKDVYKSEVISIIETIEGVDSVFDLDLEASGNYGDFQKDEEGNIIVNDLNLVYLKDICIFFI